MSRLFLEGSFSFSLTLCRTSFSPLTCSSLKIIPFESFVLSVYCIWWPERIGSEFGWYLLPCKFSSSLFFLPHVPIWDGHLLQSAIRSMNRDRYCCCIKGRSQGRTLWIRLGFFAYSLPAHLSRFGVVCPVCILLKMNWSSADWVLPFIWQHVVSDLIKARSIHKARALLNAPIWATHHDKRDLLEFIFFFPSFFFLILSFLLSIFWNSPELYLRASYPSDPRDQDDFRKVESESKTIKTKFLCLCFCFYERQSSSSDSQRFWSTQKT